MLGYHMIIKKMLSGFPINRYSLIVISLSLLLTFPRQTFSVPYALITDQGGGGRVVIINLNKIDRKVVSEIIVVGANPEGIVAYGTADSGYAYVAKSVSNDVSVIPLNVPNSGLPITINSSSFDTPRYLDITSDNRYVHVTNAIMSNNYGITVIDTTDYSVVKPQFSYTAPGDIDIYGNNAFISYPDSADSCVRFFDITNNSYNFVWQMYTSPNPPGRLVATITDQTDYAYAITGDTVSKIGEDYCEELNYFNNPASLAMHPNGKDLYVTNKGDNTVKIIDTRTNELSTTIGVGTNPNGIAFYGTTAYVVNSGNRSISVIENGSATTTDYLDLISPVEIAIIEGPEIHPNIPSNPYPWDGQTDVPVSTTLSWEGGDPEGDAVTYEVFMGTDLEMGLELICAEIEHPDTSCTPPNLLEYATTYYWMVKATDAYGNIEEVAYPYWSFTTEESAASCEVTISPSSPTVHLGETVEFSASTTCNGEITTGEYFWDLISSIGSTIDQHGLYTAGTIEGTDIVTVIDITHGEITDSTMVTVIAGALCEVTISPPSATVSSGETLAFSATTTPIAPTTECNEGSYLWAVVTPITIGSSITQDGVYTAGVNNTGAEVTNAVIATDTANGNITDAAEVTIVAQREEYYVVITPEEITLASLNLSRFTAQTFSAETDTPIPEEECNYQWEISPPSTIGSSIDAYGLYIAGLNFTDNLITETAMVYDAAHNNASASTIVTVLVKYVSIPYLILPPGPLITSYRMISVGPVWPVDGDALRLIPGHTNYNPYLIRLFRWVGQLNEGQGGYREYPDIPELVPGIGIWAITSTGGFLLVDGTPVDTDQAFPITIQPGWDQIGHPFPFTVDWDQVSIPGGENDVETPWTFVGSYLPSTSLIPWHGYFVYNNSSSPVTISIPPQESTEGTPTLNTPFSEKDEGFQLKIGVHNIPFFWLQDTYNFIGVSEGSCAGRDSKDLHKPPPISPNQVSLYFPHEREGNPERYTTDFRSLYSTNEVFECTINPGNGVISLMRLFWSDMAKVPQEYRMIFIDPETGITLNMREVSEYWFFSYLGTDKHFKISMTKISN